MISQISKKKTKKLHFIIIPKAQEGQNLQRRWQRTRFHLYEQSPTCFEHPHHRPL